jgi:hypothetical protein
MSAWLLQRWSKRQLVDANDSIFFAAEGSDAGLVGSVRLSQSRVSRVYGAEDCAGARGELISTLAAACWVTVVGEHGIKQVPEYLGFAVIRSDDSSANGLLGRKPRTRSRFCRIAFLRLPKG